MNMYRQAGQSQAALVYIEVIYAPMTQDQELPILLWRNTRLTWQLDLLAWLRLLRQGWW